MNKVLITGSGGAGKTTFACALGLKKSLPVIHLDYYFLQDANLYTDNPEAWKKIIFDLLKQDSWIMEGNYSSTYAERFALADTFIFLDVSTLTTLISIFKRRWQYRNKKRPEMPTDWTENISLEFLRYIVRYKKDSRQKLLSEIEQYKHDGMDVYIFKSRKEAYQWLESNER